MGKFSKRGLNGPYTGRVGTLVGSTWKGIPVLRSRPLKRSKPFSPGERRQQEKFALLTAFLKPVVPILNRSFISTGERMTSFNKAFSYNLKNAVMDNPPEMRIDHALVMLGRGDLPNTGSARADCLSPGSLTFIWTDNSGQGYALGTDQVFIAVYNEARREWTWKADACIRSDANYTFDLTGYRGQPVHTYIGFISSDGKNAADSIYTGLVGVAAILPPGI